MSVNEATSLFTNIFSEFANLCILSKTIVVGKDEKLWYDSGIRRGSRKRVSVTAFKMVGKV